MVYNRNNGIARCAIKVDLKKAYDSISLSLFLCVCNQLASLPNLYIGSWFVLLIFGGAINPSKSEVFCASICASIRESGRCFVNELKNNLIKEV